MQKQSFAAVPATLIENVLTKSTLSGTMILYITKCRTAFLKGREL